MPRFESVDELLDDARSRLSRVTAAEAARQVADGGALLVDIRASWQRTAAGEVPGSLVVERNDLEWRLHPTSSARVGTASPGQRWIVICAEGYTSSLAADALNSIGVPCLLIDSNFVDRGGRDVEDEASHVLAVGQPSTRPHPLDRPAHVCAHV